MTTPATTMTNTARAQAVRARCQLRWTQAGGPKMGPRDLRYIQAQYVTLADLCRRTGRDQAEVEALIEQGALPQPSYVLPEGTGMFPADYLELWEAAGDVAALSAHFRVRYQAAAAQANVELGDGEVEQAWTDYLSGLYGVCLQQVTPETILSKAVQIERIEGLLADPRPTDPGWLEALRASVDSLDGLERPFTGYDRRRFGGPTSRDRLITAVRRRYPQIS